MSAIKILVTMEDGSTFTMPDESWTKAFRIKYAGEEKEALKIFKKTVAKHWREHTIPTKFGWDDDWEENYPDQASLGKDVMYVYIRTALLAIVMEDLAIEQGKNWQPKVIGIGEKDVTEYTGHGKREMSLEEFSKTDAVEKSRSKISIQGKREKRAPKASDKKLKDELEEASEKNRKEVAEESHRSRSNARRSGEVA